jgi:hypothetical protein
MLLKPTQFRGTVLEIAPIQKSIFFSQWCRHQFRLCEWNVWIGYA